MSGDTGRGHRKTTMQLRPSYRNAQQPCGAEQSMKAQLGNVESGLDLPLHFVVLVAMVRFGKPNQTFARGADQTGDHWELPRPLSLFAMASSNGRVDSHEHIEMWMAKC